MALVLILCSVNKWSALLLDGRVKRMSGGSIKSEGSSKIEDGQLRIDVLVLA